MNASATEDLRNYATSRWPMDNHKARIWKLKRLLGWNERRVRSVYNGEDGVALRAHEHDELTDLFEKVTQENADISQSIAELEKAIESQAALIHRLKVELSGGKYSAQG